MQKMRLSLKVWLGNWMFKTAYDGIQMLHRAVADRIPVSHSMKRAERIVLECFFPDVFVVLQSCQSFVRSRSGVWQGARNGIDPVFGHQ